MYTAECLVLCDRIPEALDCLDPNTIQDISLNLVQEDSDENLVNTRPPLSMPWQIWAVTGSLAKFCTF